MSGEKMIHVSLPKFPHQASCGAEVSGDGLCVAIRDSNCIDCWAHWYPGAPRAEVELMFAGRGSLVHKRSPSKNSATEDTVRAAARVLMGAALDLLQSDPHSWSARPCATCRAIGAIAGRPFGCYVYAQAEARKAGR